MVTLEEIVEALASYAIHEGFPKERRQLAGQLLAEGVDSGAVEAIGKFCFRTVRDGNPAAVANWLLIDPVRRKDCLDDIGFCADAAAAKQADAVVSKSLTPSEVATLSKGEPTEEWLQNRNLCIAFARVVTERAPVKVVAEELGLTEKQVAALVKQERARRGVDAAARGHKATALDDEKASEERRKTWLADMRAKRVPR